MDLLIKGGSIVDGTGKPRFAADIAVDKRHIAAIGSVSASGSTPVIDASGLVVAPGFIDILNHSDAYLTILRNPTSESMLAQGVTTAVLGNCGASLAPFPHGRLIAVVQKWGETQGINVDWERFGEFLDILEGIKSGVNIASLVGHTTVRRAILGDESRVPTDEEHDKMRFLVREALAEGAFGLSYAPAYLHARSAPEWEIEKLLEEVSKTKGYFAVHLRHEDDRLLAALEEALALARRAGVRLEVSHFKHAGKGSKEIFSQALERLSEFARKEGHAYFDFYPYRFMSEVLYTALPEWAQEGGLSKMLERLRHAPTRVKIAAEISQRKDALADAKVLVARREVSLVGRTIRDLAETAGLSIGEAVAGLFLSNDGKVILLRQSFGEEDEVWETLSHPLALVGSAGAGYPLGADAGGEQPHPRSFGTFPRTLRYLVSEHKKLSLEEAVRRMTSQPARQVGLVQRGVIAKGAAADLVVFDPENITDRATFDNPWQAPEGIFSVIVNGRVVVENGKPNNTRAGQVLRHI